jgi:Tfp pilus assembly protein PilZ
MHTEVDRRFKKRVPCRLKGPGGAFSGMVLNVSRGGLFVQTSATASPGESVHIELGVDEATPLGVDACVVWRRVVGAHLRTVTTGGFGARIQYAPDAWFGFLSGLAGSEVGAASAERPAAESGVYHVRLRLAGSPRTRIVVVESADEDAARTRAREIAGAHWVVMGLASELRDA